MIEIGEYARMKSGEILKITGTCYEIDDYKIYKTDKNYTIVEDEIKSHSKNIIDLIEVGDYVDGYLIDYINLDYSTPFLRSERPYRDDSFDYKELKDKGKKYNQILHFYNEDIRSILTHEQYEENCYRLEE